MEKNVLQNRYFSGLIRRLVSKYEQNKSITEEVTKANILRIYYLSIMTMTVRVFMIFGIWNSEVEPALEFWKSGILASHTMLLVTMFFLFMLTYYYKKKEISNKWVRFVPYVTAFIVIFIGILITVIDQIITTNISPLILASVVVGTIILMRPVLSFAIYFLSYILYYFLLELMIVDKEILLTNRLNGFSIFTLGFLLSVILWNYFQTNITQKKFIEKQKNQLERMAYYDSLTGILNRRGFDELLSEEILDIQDNHHTSIILLLDIDDFKHINNEYGHPVGDEVLKEFSELLKEDIQIEDMVARFGGEEFIILMRGLSLQEGYDYSEELRTRIEKSIMSIESNHLQVTASFGLVRIDKSIDSFDDVYEGLDRALRLAKDNGKNRTEVYFVENKI